MIKNDRIIEEPDKYNGSKVSRERLSFLFMVSHKNMQDFVNSGIEFKKYLSEHLNNKLKGLSNNTEKLVEYYNSELKWREYDKVFDLSVKLFNTLSSFYALKQYISYHGNDKKTYKKQRDELAIFNKTLNAKLQMKIIDNKTSISVNEFLKDCRDVLIHKGKIICYLDLLPNNDNTKSVPALVIPVNAIWNNDYINKTKLANNHGIDSIEVFESILSCFNQLQNILDEIVKSCL